jgi:hypothetical protein
MMRLIRSVETKCLPARIVVGLGARNVHSTRESCENLCLLFTYVG